MTTNSRFSCVCFLLWISICFDLGLSDGCKSGFVQLGPWCYGFFSNVTTWEKAENACKAMNAYLAEPRSYAEEIYVEGLMFEHGVTDYVWLGGHDMVIDGEWEWATNGDL